MLMAVWDDGSWQPAVAILVVVLASYALVMWIGALIWTYRDIRARTNDAFTHAIALMVVLVFSLPGILLYMVLRPKETLADLYDRRLGSEALLQEIQEQETCPMCRRRAEKDFLACPYCGTTLSAPCERCGKALHSSWVICPYCQAERAPAASSPRVTPMNPRERPASPAAPQSVRRASTATYTPPAPKPASPAPADGVDGT